MFLKKNADRINIYANFASIFQKILTDSVFFEKS
jgi:hypothetical protein